MIEQQIQTLVKMLTAEGVESTEAWSVDYQDIRQLKDLGPFAEAVVHEAGSVRFHLEELAKWEKRFRENPLDAFSWGGDVISTAAKLSVARSLSRWIQNKPFEEWESIGDRLLGKVLDEASYGSPSSTSQISNIVESEERAAWARFIRDYRERKQ